MKTNKSYTKRLKVTKNGKVLARRPNQNHFRAKKERQTKMELKKPRELSLSQRIIRRFLPGHSAK